ncbi:hypothetical protein [Extensimonas sp. H3M7-6]|uniref:hypothetical protein n=1 Tax=Extensimonas soli TaxID=3031322 RepID=UPI0023DC3A97|nr:hypothetical protein [Extensimonas sp. H3M7-6]MDF1483508.1 hypothetical protein [Extensimonas sp. H3M7-6]
MAATEAKEIVWTPLPFNFGRDRSGVWIWEFVPQPSLVEIYDAMDLMAVDAFDE